jgi:hypothetical protein
MDKKDKFKEIAKQNKPIAEAYLEKYGSEDIEFDVETAIGKGKIKLSDILSNYYAHCEVRKTRITFGDVQMTVRDKDGNIKEQKLVKGGEG